MLTSLNICSFFNASFFRTQRLQQPLADSAMRSPKLMLLLHDLSIYVNEAQQELATSLLKPKRCRESIVWRFIGALQENHLFSYLFKYAAV